MSDANDTPPGWESNPSAWSQRLPIVGLAAAGFGVALYLALYQWRVLDGVWEPFFGNGSQEILNSKISRILPVPDAALGALGYLADAITGVIGRRSRWRTMPWVVILFALAVGPLGAVSILLVILQPVLFDSWCTLCLASAVISVLMIGPAMDELLASLQHIKHEKAGGRSVWRTFWGVSNASEQSRPGTPPVKAPAPRSRSPLSRVPPRLLNAGLGVWLLSAPAVLGYRSAAKTNDVVVGALAASVAVIALWEVTRPLRWLNFALGLWLLTAPWALNFEAAAVMNDLIVGMLLATFALWSGRARHSFGGGWASVWSQAGDSSLRRET